MLSINSKEKSMKNFFITLLLTIFALNSMASDHESSTITFEERQPSAEMEITSVQLKPGGGIIMAEGTMGEYGRVYTTFELTADSGRSGGLVTGEGRGFGPDGYFGYASFSGVYHREGTIFTMYTLVRMDDGTQNLDKIVFDGFKRSLTHDVHVVR